MKKRKPTTCGHCGKRGHNTRTCQKLKENKELQQADQAWRAVLAKRNKAIDKTLQSDPPPPAPTGKVGPTLMKCNHWSWWKPKKRGAKCQMCERLQINNKVK